MIRRSDSPGAFHGDRLGSYADELQACYAQFRDSGWMEDPTSAPRSHG